jgi:protein gp37
MAKRLQAMLDRHYRNGFNPTVHYDRIEYPLRWRKPHRVFVCSMGDLFHESLLTSDINMVLNAIARAGSQHTFMILTKRPARMNMVIESSIIWSTKPLDNVWLGVTAENQARADERIPILLQTPAAHRFVSIEPMLEPIRLHSEALGNIEWVICGGESGPGHREMDPNWARDIRDQCVLADVPFHFKQHSGPRPGWKPQLDGMSYQAKPPFTEVP